MNNKKILSILLAGTMLNGLVPYNVFANEEKLQEEQEKAVVEIVEDSKEKTLHKKEDTLEKSVKEEKREEEPKIKEEVQEDGPKIEEKLNFRKAQTRLAKFSNENIGLMPLKVLDGKPVELNGREINRYEMTFDMNMFYLNMEIGDIITLELDEKYNNYEIEKYEIFSDCEIVENSINGKNVKIKITGNNPGIELKGKKLKEIYVGNGVLEGEFNQAKNGEFKIKANDDSDEKVFLYWDFTYDTDKEYHIVKGDIFSRELTIRNLGGSETFEVEAVFGDKNKKFDLNTNHTLVNNEKVNRYIEFKCGEKITIRANPENSKDKFKEWDINVRGNVTGIYERKIEEEIKKGIKENEITFTMPYANLDIRPEFEYDNSHNDDNEIYLEEITLNINLLNEELKDKDYTVFIKKDNSYKMIDKDDNGKYVLKADDVEHSYNINILKDGYRQSVFSIYVDNRGDENYFKINKNRYEDITYNIEDNNVTANVKLYRLRDVKVKQPGMRTEFRKIGEKEEIHLNRKSSKDDFIRWEVIGVEGLTEQQLTNKEHDSRIDFEIPEVDKEKDNGIYIKEITKNSYKEYDFKVKNGKILSINGESVDSSKIKTIKEGQNEYKVIKAKDGDFIELEVENKGDFSRWEESVKCTVVWDRENENKNEYKQEKILVEILDGDASIEATKENDMPNYQRININSVKVYNDCILIDSDEPYADIVVRGYNGEKLFLGKTDKNGNAKINIKKFAENGGNISLEKEIDFGHKNAYVNIEKKIVEIIDRNYDEKDSSNNNSSNDNSSNGNSSNNSSSKDDDDSKYDKGDKVSVRDLEIREKSNGKTRIKGYIRSHKNSYISIYNDGYYVDYVKTDSDGDFDITIDEEVDSKSDLKFYAGKVRNKLEGEKDSKDDKKDNEKTESKKEENVNEIAKNIVKKHSNKGYVKGYSDGSFKPNNKVTRAEAVSMFARLINGSDDFKSSNNKFTDVDGWYADAISFISEKGLMSGYSDGSFKPNNEMTRAEFATMISKYINVGNNEKSFVDISGHWAEDAIAKVSSAGIINGYPSGEFKPDATITRAEAIAMLNRVFNKSTSGANVEFSDVKESDWFYEEIAKAIN
ncbi:S-layer homology domain-containing protein [Peptoniphilus stercorisuis]|uniref:SLH domain-containing protein n=1 Tax=Peptoniphilus stercorisuis TaxID=1436965 RepID=A0ABS4KCZ0_9FIRM|nr:S-layer homology domain-containing protein [Peptoniphilus stercorisuis]MBP2025627.1 hypothetical protein [Peptoniphilus stercorisuis]